MAANCHVLLPLGLPASAAAASAGVTTKTGASAFFAVSSRWRWAAVSTCVGVLDRAGCGDDMVRRHGQVDLVIAEFEREFAAAQELLVVPAFVVRIDHHAREPLGEQEDVVPALARIIGEVLVTRTRVDGVFLDDVERPLDDKFARLTRSQRCWQIDPHQRADDGVRQLSARQRGHGADVIAILVVGHCLLAAQLLEGQLGRLAAGTQRHLRPAPPGAAERIGQFGHRIGFEDVLIKLHPQPRQAVRRIVGVPHRRARGDAALGFVQFGGDLVVDLLLPVFMPRRAAGVAIGVGVRQDLVQLTELVFVIALGLLHALSVSGDGEQQGGKTQHETQGRSPGKLQTRLRAQNRRARK